MSLTVYPPDNMQITIIKPGLLSTIQDMGRYGHMAQAVPVSGVMDTVSARIANKCVGNNDGAAVIEFTYADASFSAETDLLIAHSGDGAVLVAGKKKFPANRPVFIPAGTNVDLINNAAGARTYLAIAGGWDVPDVLNSKSTFITANFGGMQGRALKAGDIVNSEGQLSSVAQQLLKTLKGDDIKYPDWSIPAQIALPSDCKTIRVVPGNEFTWFRGQSVIDFFTMPFSVGQRSNRMGYNLEGNIIQRAKIDELLSTAVTPGTIQVAGNGNLILLMADCQTTGGYPRIAQVAAVDLPLCAQLKPGDKIFFSEINRQEAEKLYIEREQHLQKLTAAVRHKFL